MKYRMLALLMTLGLAVSASPAMAFTWSDDFNSSSLSPFWELSGTVDHTNNRIEMTQGDSENGASIAFKFMVVGDFTATVDYAILDPVTTGYTNERIGLAGTFGAVERVSDSRFGGEVYLTDFSTAAVSPSISTTDLFGTLKVTRVGNTMTGYFWDTTGQVPTWTPISSAGYYDADSSVGMSIWPWDHTAGVKVAFDNFTLDAPNTVVTPEPASMVLFGIGGAAMAILRRRNKLNA